MSERSLLLSNNFLPKPARAAAVCGLALGIALGVGGCGNAKNPKLVGEASINCDDADLKLPKINIKDETQARAAEERLLKVQRRLCITVAEAGTLALNLYKDKEDKKDVLRFKSAVENKGHDRYDVELEATHKKSTYTLETDVATSKLMKDSNDLTIKTLTEVEVTSGRNAASIELTDGIWSMSAERSLTASDKEWPEIQDYGTVTSMSEVVTRENQSEAIQAAVNNTIVPFAQS